MDPGVISKGQDYLADTVAAGEPTRLGKLARRLWDNLLACEQVRW